MSKGYLLVCFGKEYIEEAYNLVLLLRKFGDENPVSILCNKEEIEIVKSFKVFDKAIEFDFNNELSFLDKTPFEKFGGTPKIMLVDYLPYDETIYLDTDVLVQYNTENVWNLFKQYNQAFVCMAVSADETDPLVISISKAIKKNVRDMIFPHSGIMYYNKTHDMFVEFSKTLKYFWKNYDSYGLNTRLFRSGKADEHAVMITMNKLDIKGIDGSKFPIMTHNYHKDIKLPSRIVTGGEMYGNISELDYPIPFVHMFKSHGKHHYNILLQRLLTI